MKEIFITALIAINLFQSDAFLAGGLRNARHGKSSSMKFRMIGSEQWSPHSVLGAETIAQYAQQNLETENARLAVVTAKLAKDKEIEDEKLAVIAKKEAEEKGSAELVAAAKKWAEELEVARLAAAAAAVAKKEAEEKEAARLAAVAAAKKEDRKSVV